MATRVGIGVYDENWFDHRLTLLETITVPSMAAQSDQGFTWLLVVDRNMPERAAARLAGIIAGLPNAVALPVEFKTDFGPTMAAWARDFATRQDAEYVLTSRIDDDDALVTDGVERLHAEAEQYLTLGRPGRAVFSFTVGAMWIPTERRAYSRYHDSLGIGLSVLEPLAGGVRGVYDWPHLEIKQRLVPPGGYARGIDTADPSWLYAAHPLSDSDDGDRKRLERVRGHRYGYRLDDAMLTRFGLDPVAVDTLARTEPPDVTTPVKRLATRATKLEAEITRLRGELRHAEARADTEAVSALAGRIAELDERRRAAGQDLVAGGAGVTGRR